MACLPSGSSPIINVIFGMPGIDGRNAICGTLLVSISRHFNESATGIERARSELLNGIANAVADIVRPMFITSIGRLCHQNAQVAARNGSIGKLQSDRAALYVLHGAGGKNLPFTFGPAVKIERIRAHPI